MTGPESPHRPCIWVGEGLGAAGESLGPWLLLGPSPTPGCCPCPVPCKDQSPREEGLQPGLGGGGRWERPSEPHRAALFGNTSSPPPPPPPGSPPPRAGGGPGSRVSWSALCGGHCRAISSSGLWLHRHRDTVCSLKHPAWGPAPSCALTKGRGDRSQGGRGSGDPAVRRTWTKPAPWQEALGPQKQDDPSLAPHCCGGVRPLLPGSPRHDRPEGFTPTSPVLGGHGASPGRGQDSHPLTSGSRRRLHRAHTQQRQVRVHRVRGC